MARITSHTHRGKFPLVTFRASCPQKALLPTISHSAEAPADPRALLLATYTSRVLPACPLILDMAQIRQNVENRYLEMADLQDLLRRLFPGQTNFFIDANNPISDVFLQMKGEIG